MFFLATADADNQPTCSHKGREPGFVRVVDSGTLAFPTYDGNGMFLSMGNLARNRRVASHFIDFRQPKRLRISGAASLRLDDPLLSAYLEAQIIVRVAVTRVFPNCPRYTHKFALIERSRVRAASRPHDTYSKLEEE